MPGGIEIKTRDEIGYMREASLIVYEVLEELTRAVAPGVTLEELDAIAERETVRRGGVCAFKGLYGFPKNVCISVNEQVVHGIPTRRRLVEGDLLKLDYGVIKHGYYGDSARAGEGHRGDGSRQPHQRHRLRHRGACQAVRVRHRSRLRRPRNRQEAA